MQLFFFPCAILADFSYEEIFFLAIWFLSIWFPGAGISAEIHRTRENVYVPAAAQFEFLEKSLAAGFQSPCGNFSFGIPFAYVGEGLFGKRQHFYNFE